MKPYRIIFSLLTFLVVFSSPILAFAQGAGTPCAVGQYKLIAPIGTLDCVDFKGYVEGVFQIMIGIAGVLAVVMIVLCGIKLIGSGSASGKTAAKDCIINAVFGILLALGAWVLLNTINPLLLDSNFTLVDAIAAPKTEKSAVTTEKDPTEPGWWFKYEDLAGSTRFSGPFSQSACEEVRAKTEGTEGVKVVSQCYEVKTKGAPTAATPSTPAPDVKGVACSMKGVNLCEPKMWRAGGKCTNNNCAAYAGPAGSNATGAATANLIKAIIWQESSCNYNAVGPTTKYGQACGPMQMLPSTAQTLKKDCNIPDNVRVDCSYLTNKQNLDKAICLGAKYIDKLQGKCGSEVRNIAAGYNSGPGNCADSNSCGGDKSCGSGSVRKWECIYNDNAHEVCNTGFDETRKYATQVLYCNNSPAY